MHGNHASRAHAPQQRRWDLHGDAAIHQQFALVMHGLKQAWIGATGADGHVHVALLAKEHRFAGVKIGGDDTEGDFHVLKLEALE
jgi:hypothetical protein